MTILRTRLEVESLEARAVPAASLNTWTGVLRISADYPGLDNKVSAYYAWGYTAGILVELNGSNGHYQSAAFFPSWEVQRIVFVGTNGGDWFRNDTGIPSDIYGVGGNDILIGGFSGDRIYGGEGIDYLFGNYGNDLLVGEQGADYLYGNDGFDTLDAVTNADDYADHLWGGGQGDTFLVRERWSFWYGYIYTTPLDQIMDFSSGDTREIWWW